MSISPVFRAAIRTAIDRSRTLIYGEPSLFKRMVDSYEDFIGVKEVRDIQLKVLSAESQFIQHNRERRHAFDQLKNVQEQLKQVRSKLDSISRADEAYLDLVTNEHRLIKQEKLLDEQLTQKEEVERNSFQVFSQQLRDSQEVERLRQEKTKYLSLLGSLVGALLGVIATTINYALKKSDFKRILEAIENQSRIQQEAVALIVPSDDPRSKSNDQKSQVLADEQKQLLMKNEEKQAQLAELIETSRSDLEYKMKVNTIIIVAASYALIAVTMPLIFKIFGD